MKTSDVIIHLQKFLPRVTDEFSSVNQPDSITISTQDSKIATFDFLTAHGLEENEIITITDSKIKTEIETISIDPNTQIVSCTTFTNHDLTERQIKEITISGSTDPNLNGVFPLLTVPNRRSFSFQYNQNTITNPGTVFLEEERTSGNINNSFIIFNVTSTTFDIELEYNFPIVEVSTVNVHSSIRISGGGDIEKILLHYEQMISNQAAIKDLWAFVILGDATTSKDRYVNNDASTNQGNLNAWNVQILRPFSVYLIVPSEQDITARKARDTCEDLRSKLYSVLLGVEFPSGFSTNGGSATAPLGDELAGYYESYYVHQFRFEQVDQVCEEDIKYLGEDSANRDIDFDLLDVFNDTDEVKLISRVDLDDEPLTN